MSIPNKSEDVDSFDHRSRGYEASFTQFLFFDRVQHIVLDLAASGKPPATVLDIGCGTGRLLRKAAALWPGVHLIGVDPAEGMLNEARRRSPEITFHLGQAESLPLPDASADLVMSTLSFHHWEDQPKGICEAARVLRPGGRFVLADILTPLRLARVFVHGRQTEPGGVRTMFTNAGLKVNYQRRRLGWIVLVTLGEVK